MKGGAGSVSVMGSEDAGCSSQEEQVEVDSYP